MVKIGIIGGTGVYDPNLIEDAKKIKVHTPYGKPSDFITTGVYKGKEVAVIPRHAAGHRINPSDVNYRANIWALKDLGVTHILTSSAVGSLKKEYAPGHLAFADQFIDRTYRRKTTFYEGDTVCHVSTAEPVCPALRNLFIKAAKKLNYDHHERATCVVVEGPRFSTKAESKMYQQWGGDIIGMTMHPEATLAREAEICYATVAMVTDYDCWYDEHVDAEAVMKTMKANVSKVKDIFSQVIPEINDKIKTDNCGCNEALKFALM
ncbi:MAG: S-methyl-5'-thioadenosine phosphorylase [Nanoarchaeota archaeon]|nr:S-methyl-5'-thioadenosine phosphorylase [Nanoarchaeota archaeon]MCG2717582.1 S-methyl-5'-thioadenosine phosphorylase [Nanoarchaeota archaeon]